MVLIFLGTPTFAVPTLERIVEAGHHAVAVFTQPDRPKGRGRQVAASPVKEAAMRLGLAVYQPERIRRPEVIEQLKQMKPEAMVVVGYGQIIPQAIIDIPPRGIINVHASLLPKYRGAAPIQWAVAMGETITGNSTMLLEEGLDTGPILRQREIPIAPEQTAADLFEVLARDGAPLVVETLTGLESGTIAPKPQDHSGATLAPLLTREDGHMDFSRYTAKDLINRWRGFQPWPGAYTVLDRKKVIVHRMKVLAPEIGVPVDFAPGTVFADRQRMLAACAQHTWLEFLEVQLEGKKRISAADFLHGRSDPTGIRLG